MATERTRSLEFKQSADEARRQAVASIEGAAMAHGISANQLHKWRRRFPNALTTRELNALSPLPTTVDHDQPERSPVDDSAPDQIDIELGRVRILLSGRVDPDVLHTVLATLGPG